MKKKRQINPRWARLIDLGVLLGTFATLVHFHQADAAEPVESGAGRVCGTLKNFQGEVQVFDSSRTHLGDAAFGTKLRCGDWLSVEKGKAVVEHFSGAALAVSDRTFIQILDPQSGENPEHAHFTLYRGEMVVSAPEAHKNQGATEIRVTTPNAILRVTNGTAFTLYSTSADETQGIGLGGSVSIENRFFPEKRMTAGFAQYVSFADPVERLVPETARLVNPRDLNERLAKLGIPQAVRDRVDSVVKVSSKTKMPVTLATAPKVAAPETGGEFHAADRAPASVSAEEGTAKKSVVMAKKPVVKKSEKKPRVVHVAKDEPDFQLKREGSETQEKEKLMQALSTMRPDEE